MKKMVVLLGLMASFLLVTGCANKVQNTPESVDTHSAAHQDLKGEIHKGK